MTRITFLFLQKTVLMSQFARNMSNKPLPVELMKPSLLFRRLGPTQIETDSKSECHLYGSLFLHWPQRAFSGANYYYAKVGFCGSPQISGRQLCDNQSLSVNNISGHNRACRRGAESQLHNCQCFECVKGQLDERAAAISGIPMS